MTSFFPHGFATTHCYRSEAGRSQRWPSGRCRAFGEPVSSSLTPVYPTASRRRSQTHMYPRWPSYQHYLLLPDSYSPTSIITPRLILLLPDSDSYSPIQTHTPTPPILLPDSYSCMYTTSALLLYQLDPHNQRIK